MSNSDKFWNVVLDGLPVRDIEVMTAVGDLCMPEYDFSFPAPPAFSL